jgi:hypothetical protein
MIKLANVARVGDVFGYLSAVHLLGRDAWSAAVPAAVCKTYKPSISQFDF